MEKKFLFALASTILSKALFAGTMGAVHAPSSWMSVIAVTIGSDFVNPGQPQTLTLLPPFQNYYTKDSASKGVLEIGGFIGGERVLTEKLSLQLGVSAYRDSSMTAKGDVWQFTLPEFDDLSYFYRMHHVRITTATKLLVKLMHYPALHPYISGELGAAFNRTSAYQETPLQAGVIPTPSFSNHRTTSVAWGVGAGVDYNLNQELRLGLGYQFADLGSASLGQTTGAVTGQSLKTSHLYANQLRFQVTLLV